MRARFVELLESTERKGIDKLINYMANSGFFEAPCSGGNHLAKEGGLLEHSLNVYDCMCDIANSLLGEISPEMNDSIIICSLLHDLGKIGDFGKPNYVPNMIKDGRPTKAEPEQKYKQSEAKPYVSNSELLHIPHEIRSIEIASRFIDLTEDENFAILYHNGLYGALGYELKGKETPLYLLLHFADMWASRVVEVEEKE